MKQDFVSNIIINLSMLVIENIILFLLIKFYKFFIKYFNNFIIIYKEGVNYFYNSYINKNKNENKNFKEIFKFIFNEENSTKFLNLILFVVLYIFSIRFFDNLFGFPYFKLIIILISLIFCMKLTNDHINEIINKNNNDNSNNNKDNNNNENLKKKKKIINKI